MIPCLPCEAAREQLEPFLDGELSTADQVAVQAHLRSCPTCAAHVEDLSLIGWSVRAGMPTTTPAATDVQALAAVQSDVLTRIRVERAQSLRTRLPELFSDTRLLWPALGATAAVLACLVASVNIWMAAISKPPSSLAAMIETLDNAGSDSNPLRFNRQVSAPRVIHAGYLLDGPSRDDAYAVAAVVTREGRVHRLELLSVPGYDADLDAAAVLDAVRTWRFTPAQGRRPRGQPVAVEIVVWIEETTVRMPAPIDYVPPVLKQVPAGPSVLPAPSGARSVTDPSSATV